MAGFSKGDLSQFGSGVNREDLDYVDNASMSDLNTYVFEETKSVWREIDSSTNGGRLLPNFVDRTLYPESGKGQGRSCSSDSAANYNTRSCHCFACFCFSIYS
jgi:hypothetical protein